MFAVPGWSVSADALKAEKTTPGNGAAAGTKSRKRKRAGAKEENVTADNVADLYESVVEGKKPNAVKAGQKEKRQKKTSEGEVKSENQKQTEKATEPTSAAVEDKKEKKDKKNRDQKGKGDGQEKKKKKEKGSKPDESTGSTEVSAPKSDAVVKAQAAALPPAPSKLTPLQASMREKLISARFRHLNETLYTRPSEESFTLFQDSPEMFDEYHEGFRRQVKVWPENPVDSFLQDIRTRAKVRTPGKGRPNQPQAQLSATALPRTVGTCTIADLGCGDARLAESLQADKDKSRLDVKSYDLQSPSPLVTKADISNLPLEDGSINVAIFCLALMGTNWLDFVEEAYRILHWKGELWVAEIKSRFGPVRNKNAPVTHSVGNRRKPTMKETAAKDAEVTGKFEQDLAVEVDGLDDRRRETDVSAFVEALRKRGFVMQGERNEAVDLSNRMFVKMHFIKGASPTVGKGAKPQEAAAAAAAPPKKRKMYAFAQDNKEEEQINEAAILKPCVYKIR
ncbi:25S rRNA (adenine-N(1))-methyltransferase [Cladobotryum mycophilum]|uniref:Ribosomal RNA-processing protein 8 n=1 Tax=Cladobotryum mycophilum TaxID=491253 RepID=A0ABR0T2L2_9HYPO